MKGKPGEVIHYEVITKCQVQPDWSRELLLILPLEGEIDVLVLKESFHLKKGDILLVRPFQYYYIYKIKGSSLLYYIDVMDPENGIPETLVGNLKCNSTLEPEKTYYTSLIILILHSVTADPGNYPDLKQKRFFYQIIDELNSRFATDNQKEEGKNAVSIQDILTYLNRNYNKNITMADLTGRFYLSGSYISRLFRQQVGTSFLKYLNEVRLVHACGQLLDKTRKIEQIASDNGFKNARTFSTMFKEYYGMLPREWRKQAFEKRNSTGQKKDNTVCQKLMKEYLQSLEKTTPKEQWIHNHVVSEVNVTKSKHQDISMLHKILTIRKANHLLMHSNREYLKKIIMELGFSQIYFHELFHDEMELYSINAQGEPKYNFYKIDQLFDLFMEFHIIPYVELSFVPFAMAEDRSVSYIVNNSVSSMPADMGEWEKMIETVMQHLIRRYGLEQVSQWRFCVWNSPDNKDINKSGDKEENFYLIYQKTYETIKKLSSGIRVGTSALMCVNLIYPEWMDRFCSFYKENNCTPDFVMVNMYTVEDTPESIRAHHMPTMSQNPDALYNAMMKIKQNNKKSGWGILEFAVPEWDFDLCSGSMLNDSLFKACYIVKNMVDCSGAGWSFGLVDPVDRYPDISVDQSSFYGGKGLVTYNGILKPSYYAYAMLQSMGDEVLCKDKNILITKRGKQIQVLLYNYFHFSKAYADRTLKDFKDMYKAFPKTQQLRYEIVLSNLPERLYLKEALVLNEMNGNTHAFCQKNQQTSVFSKKEIRYINDICQPLWQREYTEIPGTGGCKLMELLEPFEIRLIRLTPV